MSFFTELKRRNVIKVAAAYVIVAWLILQVGEVLAPALRLPDWTNSFLAFILILGFPLAMFFAWAFELTPEGIKREKHVERDESVTHATGQKLNTAITVLLVLALGYFVADKFWIQPRLADDAQDPVAEAGAMQPSIAVLPFADLSPAGDHEYFSDGLTEELLNILAKIHDLQVAGRTSSFAFKGKNEDLRSIGEKLNVNTILEGSVRKDEQRNRVRITAQLINVEDGYHLWSETYDRDLVDIFAIQEEIAHQVADALKITLLGEDEARIEDVASTDIDAYDLYLKARTELARAGFVNLDNARELFQQVLGMDPSYTPARLGLVQTWSKLALTGAMTTREALERGLPMLQAIVEADPNDAAALRLMAVYMEAADDTEAAERFYRRSLELDPRSATTLQEYGRFLYDHHQVERGVALMDAAVESDPYNPDVLWDACSTRSQLGEFERALVVCRRIQEIEPTGPQGYYGEALAHLFQGDLAQTTLGYSRAIERDPEDFEMLAAMTIFWTALGDAEQAKAWLERAEAIGAGRPVPTNARILLYEFNEQFDRAGELAVQALARRMDDRHGTEFFFRRANAAYASRTGNWQAGLAPYRELLPWLFEAELNIPEEAVDYVDDIIHAAALVKAADPLSGRWEELLAFAESHASDFYPAWGEATLPHRLASISAIRGDTEAAIEHLRDVREFGLFPYWRPSLIDAPQFAKLKESPQYRAIIADAEAEAERQRAEARSLLGVDHGQE